jgi:hypothetical protein
MLSGTLMKWSKGFSPDQKPEKSKKFFSFENVFFFFLVISFCKLHAKKSKTRNVFQAFLVCQNNLKSKKYFIFTISVLFYIQYFSFYLLQCAEIGFLWFKLRNFLKKSFLSKEVEKKTFVISKFIFNSATIKFSTIY